MSVRVPLALATSFFLWVGCGQAAGKTDLIETGEASVDGAVVPGGTLDIQFAGRQWGGTTWLLTGPGDDYLMWPASGGAAPHFKKAGREQQDGLVGMLFDHLTFTLPQDLNPGAHWLCNGDLCVELDIEE